MSLPLVLGGYGRNMFINLGFALGNSAIFYGTLIFTQYLGGFQIISPPMTAWAPLMGFGVDRHPAVGADPDLERFTRR